MTASPTRLALAALLLGALAAPAVVRADSLASSASSAASDSVGSISNSIGRSSDSSSPNRRVADGDYRVVDVAAVRAGMLTLTLRGPATAAAGEVDEFTLDVPVATAERAGIARGDTVVARQRPYGIEFGHAGDGGAFFLALADDWLRELASTPVPL